VSRTFDAIIVGAGQAGPALANRLTAAGRTVAIVERHLVGGTCVNTGCKPTKTLVASAYAARLAQRGAEYGIGVGSIAIDMPTIAGRARKVILDARKGNEDWLAGMPGLTFISGHARFTGPRRLEVNSETIEAPQVFLNVGGRANVPDFPGIDQVDYLTNSTIIPLESVPGHLVVVGGSYIGLEFAQMYRRFGAKVTVVEQGPRLVQREDEDVSGEIRAFLEEEGIEVRTNACCITLAKHPEGVSVGVDCTEGSPEVVGTHVLLAVGRRPNTDELGLDKAGIAVDERGYIEVDDRLATTAEGVWAMGDCNGKGAFTHTAWNDYEIVAANLLDGEDRKVSDMTETQARKSGRPILLSKRPMSRVGRAVEKGETHGFMKIVADAETKKILGAAILGTGGDEAIHGILDMMNADASIGTLQWAMPIHPTVSELIPTVVGELKSP
jgi:pyruvate/2-oxoglutarate dehydrogenase complex dihydrolipoamide dehydrogenase (E3) component